jgi:hypothetical protein
MIWTGPAWRPERMEKSGPGVHEIQIVHARTVLTRTPGKAVCRPEQTAMDPATHSIIDQGNERCLS